MSEEKEETHHYVYGSGMPGCLYDYGPHFVEKKEDAIDSFLQLFGDQLAEGEAQVLRDDLMNGGIHYFHNPQEAGAVFCEVSKQPGACPVTDDG